MTHIFNKLPAAAAALLACASLFYGAFAPANATVSYHEIAVNTAFELA